MNQTDSRLLKTVQVIGRLDRGGAQCLAGSLALALQEIGIRSYLIALRGQSRPSALAGSELAVEAFGTGKGALAYLGCIIRFRRYIQRHRPNIVHVHGSNCIVLCAIALLGMRQRPIILFTWHDSEGVLGENSWQVALTRWALRRCHRLFGSSQDVALRLERATRHTRNVSVLRNGVRAIHAPSPRARELPVIVWVGRLVPPKDPELFLHAVAALNREEYRFRARMLGGAPPHLRAYEERLKRMAAELGVADVVDFAGWVEDTSLELMNADIAVQSSRTEGLSMALLEQMMAGLAIVATDVGDTAEALDGGRCGLLTPPNDTLAMVSRLRQLLQDADLRRRLGDAARQRAIQHYSLSSMAQQVLAAYEACVAEVRL